MLLVLKCRFHYFSRKVRPKNQKTTTNGEITGYSHFSREWDLLHYVGPQESQYMVQKAERVRGKHRQITILWFL